MTSFDNNEEKVCLLLKNDVNRSHVRLYVKSYNLGSYDHNITVFLNKTNAWVVKSIVIIL